MRSKSVYAKVESIRGKKTLTPVAFCMRSAEPGNRPDIFAAAECDVMGSGGCIEPRGLRKASDVTE